MRRNMVGTSEAKAMAPEASKAAVGPASKASSSTTVPPSRAQRHRMEIPPTWYRGSTASQRSPATLPRRACEPAAEAAQFSPVSTTGRPPPEVPEVSTTKQGPPGAEARPGREAATGGGSTGPGQVEAGAPAPGGPHAGFPGQSHRLRRKEAGAEDHRHRPGPRQAPERGDGGRGALPPQGHPVPGDHPGGGQVGGHPVGGGVEGAVGDGLRTAGQRRAVGGVSGGGAEPVHGRGLTTVPGRRPPPVRRPPVPVPWELSGDYEDILYATAEGIAKVTINRPEVRNAFRPTTLFELSDAFERARNDSAVGVIILTGAGDQAFCSGGDQRIRGDAGYVDPRGIPRLNVLDLQIQMRRLPKPIIAMVAGYAIGGGHVLHLVCDLTIAADNAVFGQTGPRVGSFDGGYGAGLLARMVGDKRAREIWYLCRQYSAQEAFQMGMVNKVVPLADLEAETVSWAREILAKSPLAVRLMKAALNAAADGLAGQQQLAGDATLLFYMSEEAQEGRDSFVEKRDPDFSRFPRLP